MYVCKCVYVQYIYTPGGVVSKKAVWGLLLLDTSSKLQQSLGIK